MKKVITTLIILLVIAGIYFGFIKKSNSGKTTTTYKYGDVKKGSIEVKILATGSIKPFNQVGIKATSRGRIEEVFVQEGDFVEVGTVLATISSEDRNAILDAAISQMKLAKESKDKNAIKEADIAYNVAISAYKPVFLISTIKGEIINRDCEPGQNVDLSNILFVLSDKLVARVDVDEVDIAKMKNGLKAYIYLDSYPDEIINGKISKISREGKTISDVVLYEIMIDPERIPTKWASGMTANIEFVTQSKQDVIICPKSALKEENKKSYVLVKKSLNGKGQKDREIRKKDKENIKKDKEKVKNTNGAINNETEKRFVERGIDDGRNVEIISGLEIDEKVVTEITEISNEKNANSLFGRPGNRKK
ncbi:MAG: HlyD family efflux transporter periplasmic adaptor subunit [Candidatus Muirbacterium halophilum]|nr:HlyD family efflux transporter periplasmic adaptor subunit [Candidatus Muirbacterium halophilum]MCK9476670.1 HlyD family efflux transporter periplasmic adaptor subunit [Candidatus Muirbacterium halophilum]